MRLRMLARFAAMVLGFLATTAAAQAPTSLIGSLSAADSAGRLFGQGSFSCSGTDPCVGTYESTAYPVGCSNPTLSADRFTLTGLNLAQPGPIAGRLRFTNASTAEAPQPGGTCTVSQRSDLVLDFTGSWNGSTATVVIPPADLGGPTGPLTVSVSFRSGSLPPTQVTGSARAVGQSPAHTIDVSFSCEGEPVCVGTYRGEFVGEQGCRDTTVAGVQLTGMDLSRPGAIQGLVTFKDFDWQDVQGPCGAPIPGTFVSLSFAYTGNWNRSQGTIAFDYRDGQTLFRFSGSFTANRIPPPPVFPMIVTANVNAVRSSASAQILFRPQDVGTAGSVYVFALAPASLVRSNPLAKAQHFGHMAKSASKADPPVQCVLAQLNASGQLVGVSVASLQAYVTGVLSASGQAVTILNGVPTVNIGGATFFVGYGPNSTSMINSGTNRGAVTIPAALECRPQSPQTGWWWDPPPSAGARSPRDGTGYSIETQGNLLFFAAFLYDASGRSSWYVSSGRTSLEGSLFVGDLLQASGGQTLGGTYRPFSAVSNAGQITLAFNSATSGTMVWPGGTVPLGRFDIVPNGLSAAPRANQPESGWWWNPAESGRGFFIEWQDGWADLAGYMYDDAGNPVWYITVAATPDPMRLSGSWLSFGNGMTLNGPWRAHQLVNGNVAPVTITFTSATTATMTLPNGRTTGLVRHRF